MTVIDRATLKSQLKLIIGGKVGKVRDPKSILATLDVVSPVDPEIIFTIKKAGNREDIQRANLFATVRYVQEDEQGKVVSEREFPMGDLQVTTIQLCLFKWTVELSDGVVAPINRENITNLMLPEERVDLYNKILDFNPIWTNRAEVKND